MHIKAQTQAPEIVNGHPDVFRLTGTLFTTEMTVKKCPI